MGCVKSKRSAAASQHANSTERKPTSEKAYLMGGSAPGSADGSPQVNAALLEYAQRLSEDIVARAVQQWLEVDSRYSDIPYIECDVP
ncbi:small membrane A-kinase anchor protein [Xiphophorus couchianus]|uniref:small membrane A-kinase anchor protein n=1 Tax=Xiphophorus couchianus TaxID=32473 RepID=UPI0010167CCE|nr:small membrane A-kinase anchor protein [Xiphophorus couchianus]XP_032423374.1 small membrane A-kinase anchor protein [Xiphophorus hellerii]